ncbi:hypothetical protein [Streptomyces sp. GS7]|uniref:hypothetical protein n=1 Tax=Streptomyces sp. GS7 TaxID=2692234 RepID=UPI0013177CD5|nr:hypothetical protein [Streptomyces sp. GS7]QHC24577.1 hypothetical protein GR130_27615 [Streptomyces sp. GS7]
MTTDLPPAWVRLPFDDEEAVALAAALCAAATGASSLTGIDETAVRAMAKLEQILPTHLRDQVSAVQKSTVSMSFDGPSKVDLAALTTLAAACRDHEIPTRYSAQATVPSDTETVRTRTGAFPSRVHSLDNRTCTIDPSADDPLHIAAGILTLGPGATLHGTPELAPHMEEFAHRLAHAARALAQSDDECEADR